MAISGQTRMTVQPHGEQVYGACPEPGVRILPLPLSACYTGQVTSLFFYFLMCGMGVIAVRTPRLTVTTLKDLVRGKHLGALL